MELAKTAIETSEQAVHTLLGIARIMKRGNIHAQQTGALIEAAVKTVQQQGLPAPSAAPARPAANAPAFDVSDKRLES